MIIDEKAKISLYAVAVCLPFIVGAILWLSSVASDAKEAKSEVQGLKPMLLQVRDSVIRIEQKMDDQ